MSTRTRSSGTDLLKKILESRKLKRLAKSGYRIADSRVKDSRRAKLPPAREAPARKAIAKTLAAWYRVAGLEKKRRPKTSGTEPVDDGIKKVPKFKVKASVTNLKVARGGTFLQFDFKTTVPCIPLICARRGPLGVVEVGGSYKLVGEPEYTSLLGTIFSGYKTSHSVALIDMKPSVKFDDDPYQFVILLKPKDKDRAWLPTAGSAPTLKRHVVVTVDEVKVQDAADFGGTGEMYFKSQLGRPGFNRAVPGHSLDHAICPAENDPGGAGGGFMYVSSGDRVHPHFILHGQEIGDRIEHTFSAVERDAGSVWPGSLDTYGGSREPDRFEGTYDIGSFEAAGSGWSYNVDGGTLMSGENGDALLGREVYSVDYVRHVGGGITTDLEYTIYGKIIVIYLV